MYYLNTDPDAPGLFVNASTKSRNIQTSSEKQIVNDKVVLIYKETDTFLYGSSISAFGRKD